MTDREELIELLGLYLPINVPNRIGSYDTIGERTLLYDDRETLADHLLANGVIVPPCKVGEELYCVYSPPHPANPADKGKWYMNKFEVARFHYGVKGLSIEMYGYGTVNANEIGKTVFIGDNAKEEAEKALAERQSASDG